MRGKVGSEGQAVYLKGITPAYAGKSSALCVSDVSAWDHPRVCGEKALHQRLHFAMLGSPPRMRGKAVWGGASALHTGITPAYAGKRGSTTSWRAGRWDHPRVCGEKRLQTIWVCLPRGSPPRMRGKGRPKRWECGSPRITPAYAGKSNYIKTGGQSQKDHPRVCGEKGAGACRFRSFSGSPPRMRGKGSWSSSVLLMIGITPAYAGKSNRRREVLHRHGDHPRICGEKPQA